MKKIIIYLLLSQLGIAALFAQESLSGVVLSEDRKGRIMPVPFANVYWQGTNIGTTTDTSGSFHLALSEESSRLIVSSVGYTADTISISNFNKPITVQLKQSVALDEVEIEYRRRTSEMSFINPLQQENISERELFKAACCNLSESFETNPSVDVNFTDAITGSKQIQMLGLDGPYTMISRENMPGIRGLGNAFGLSFIPGTWISSIQVTKGVGSVVNGYESIAGQINTELKKPDEGEQSFLNVFANQSGRTEVNFINTQQVSEHWGTTLLLHGNVRPIEQDRNDDGFMDFPTQQQINVMNRWKYTGQNGWMGQIGVHYVNDAKEGGQTQNFIDDQEGTINFEPYQLEINTERIEAFTKTGYVFPNLRYKSIGLQMSALYHDQESFFGNRKYDATERSGYANLIYQSIIGNSFHKFKTGLSYLYDDYEEQLDSLNFDRTESVPGAFFEYTYQPSNNITLVAGLRADHHNLFGSFLTPRLHARWAADEQTVFRVLAGSGQRTANIFAERQSLLATSRTFEIMSKDNNLPYGLEAERAWNFGFNIMRNFKLDYRDGYVSLDFYRTEFQEQVVVDLDESAGEVVFHNLNGDSYSNSAQVELNYELLKFLNMRLAYRWLEVRTNFISGLKQKPLTAKHRLFANFSYETQPSLKGKNWMFDLTAQWIGEQRIPTTADNPVEYQRSTSSPSFMLFNAQITHNVNKRWAIYGGMENIFDFRQDNPIIDPENPFGNNFDASLVWGPIFGRMVYGGVRFRIQKEE
ncbi:MAG: TonB-dependent receptor [Vicingaceae bacterium]